MTSSTIEFCRYAVDEFRSYGTSMYHLFADICEDVCEGDITATAIVRCAVTDVLAKNDFDWNDDRELYALMTKYINQRLVESGAMKYYEEKLAERIASYKGRYFGEISVASEFFSPKKFYDEVDLYFNYKKKE